MNLRPSFGRGVRRNGALALLAVAMLLCAVREGRAGGADWPPIPAADLSMKEYPALKGTPAVVLLREVRTDDVQSYEDVFVRIKVFTDEGKKYGDIEIRFLKGEIKVEQIAARTVQPDGQEVPFRGQVYEKVVAKAGGIQFLAKTFSLPDVRAGSILDYRYRLRWDENDLLNSKWFPQHELPTRHVSFTLKPYSEISLYWISAQLPASVSAAQGKDQIVRLEMDNVPPFQEEEFMPPSDGLKMRVEFFYSRMAVRSPEDYWKQFGQAVYDVSEKFIGKRQAIAQEVARIVSPDDPPEVKLRKIYARAQQIRNLSFERDRTSKEEKREGLKENSNSEDVLKHGYGDARDINYVFIAMLRAAGLEAYTLRLCRRDKLFFNPKLLDRKQLDDDIVLVRANGQDYFLDPSIRFAPFGLLSWGQTAVQALKSGKGDATFVRTPQPQSSEARVERKAKLRLAEGGVLEGTAEILFYGREAMGLRLDALDEDEAGRTKELTDRIKEWLPGGAKVDLEKVEGWNSSQDPLRVECKLMVPEAALAAGRRIVLSAGVFQSATSSAFQHANRHYPVYFHFPYQREDDITIEVPNGIQIESIPSPRSISEAFGGYEITRERNGNTYHLHRRFALHGYYFPQDWYPVLQTFFSKMKSADEEQAVLQVAASASR